MRGLLVGLVAGLCWMTPAWAAAPHVVASIKPVHALVAGIMDGVGAPDVLIKGAGSVHAYSLRPSEAEILQQADVVFWVGPAFENFLAKPLSALAVKAQVVALIDAPGMEILPARAGGIWDDADHTAHTDAHYDGHIWLSPANAKAMVAAIAQVLSTRDPTNAARYRANATALDSKLDALDAELRAKLAPVKDKPFVVFHDAYQYFEKSYGLHAAGSITVTPDRAPGARRVAEIKAKLESLGPTCVFAEPQFEPKLVQSLVAETHAKTGVLDPEGSTLTPGPDLHFNLMRKLAGALVGCLARP